MNEYIIEYRGHLIQIITTYGYIEGNTNIRANVMYNDFDGYYLYIEVTYGGATIHYKNNDMDESGQVSTQTDSGNTTGDALCGVYESAITI